MENKHIQGKMKLLFGKIVEKDYAMDNYYSDGLIEKLSDCSDPEISFLASVPLVSDLIIEVLNCIEHSHNSVVVFVTRMLAIASQKELHFAKVFSKHGDVIVKGFKDINSPTMKPSLRVAYLELALALVQHNSGISWLLETGVWKEVLSLCNEKRTVFVVRQTYKFASKFFWKINDLGDETNIKMLLSFLLTPITTVDFANIESMSSEDEDKLSKTIEPMLQIILSVLTEPDRIGKPGALINILIKEYTITTHLYLAFDRLRREDMTLLIAKLLFWLAISKLFLAKPLVSYVVYNAEDFMDMSVAYFNTVQLLIQRRLPTLVLDYCNACNLIWISVWNKNLTHSMVNVSGQDMRQNLQNQLMFICLVPALVYVKKVSKNSCTMTNDRLDEYIMKVLNFTSEHMARVCYGLRDLAMAMGILSVTLQSVKRLTCLKFYLNNEQANLMFQALFYLLKEYDPTDEHGDMQSDQDYADCQEKDTVMTYVLDIVLCLVKDHDVNWHESLEIICLYNIVYNILKRPNLSCKFIVTALNVIAVTVKKFLQPNLSLLLEAQPGTSMHDLGKLIYMKMHDMNWEVRDSALELLLVCTELSFVKFPPFQKQIMENNLINVAATIAFNDREYYVQVSALKCIGAATKINNIWEQLKTQYPDIQEKLILILRNNDEGIVRKETCSVLCDVYQNLKLTATFKNTLYSHMVSSALSDFHWEVQLSALKFWRIVIQSLLNDQGMLDGTFPPVTFSRETRKIVTLNEPEIQRRFLKILDELSMMGCLTVLVKLLHDDTEVDILDATISISLELLNILVQYKVPEVLKPNDNDPTTAEDLICNIKEVEKEDNDNGEGMSDSITPQIADNVIEGILNADDINLLANIYNSHMNIEKPVEAAKPKIKLLKYASPHLFVDYLKGKDFKAILEQKRKWKEGIRSLSSLLDDVLGIYEANDEVNDLDCY